METITVGTITTLLKFFIDFVKGDVNLFQLGKAMIKYILTIIMANILFKWWFYANYSFIELSMENISKYICSGEILKPILSFLAAYFLFYGILFSLLRYLLSAIIERKIMNKVNKLTAKLSESDKREAHSVFLRVLRKVIRWEYKFGILSKKDLSTKFDNDNLNEMSKDAFVTICICVHAIVVYGFFYNFFTVGMAGLYIFCMFAFAFISVVPIVLKIMSPFLNKVLEHEDKVR